MPEQDDVLSPQATCEHPKLEKSWLWPFIEQFWAGLDVREGQGRWWETSQPLMLVGVLGSSWDDAFVEDTPSSLRDAPVKVRAAPQENSGGCKSHGKKISFPVGM